jgi:hypothetical protein
VDRTSAWRGNCSRADSWCRAVLIGLSLCVLSPAIARAAEASDAGAAPLVVVISNNPDTPFVRRLAAELSLFGYRVEVAARASADGELSDLLEASGGAALIAVDQGKQVVDVVVASSGNVAARHERERIDPRRRADTNAAVLAERFRARLTELGIAPTSSVDAEPQPPPVYLSPPAAPTPERRLWLAAAVGTTSGGLGFVPDVQLEIRAFPASWLSTSAFGKLSLAPAQVRDTEGASDVRLSSGGVLIDVYPWRDSVVVKAGVGALLVDAEMSGEAAGPWVGQDDSVLVAAGLVEAGAAYRLTPRVSAEVVGFAGVCSPRVGVRFEGRSVAHYGQPFFGLSVGVAVGVF